MTNKNEKQFETLVELVHDEFVRIGRGDASAKYFLTDPVVAMSKTKPIYDQIKAINSFLSTQIGSAGLARKINTINIRHYLINDVEKTDDWLAIFHEVILPAIMTFNIPFELPND